MMAEDNIVEDSMRMGRSCGGEAQCHIVTVQVGNIVMDVGDIDSY